MASNRKPQPDRERDAQTTETPAVAGFVPGGLGGELTAALVDPEQEDAYWREQFRSEPYFNANYSYEDYAGAYRTGYEGCARLGSENNYDEVEPELQREYERNCPNAKLPWDQARPAVRAGWARVQCSLCRYIGYAVLDRDGSRIGRLKAVWIDRAGQPAFLGVKAGWIFGKTHVVPAQNVEVNAIAQRLRLPYAEAQVKDAPTFDASADLDEAKQQELFRYYDITSDREAERPPVEVGVVRVKKIVRIENPGEAPVEFVSEEIALADDGVYVPLRDEAADDSAADRRRVGAAKEIHECEERPRSQRKG